MAVRELILVSPEKSEIIVDFQRSISIKNISTRAQHNYLRRNVFIVKLSREIVEKSEYSRWNSFVVYR